MPIDPRIPLMWAEHNRQQAPFNPIQGLELAFKTQSMQRQAAQEQRLEQLEGLKVQAAQQALQRQGKLQQIWQDSGGDFETAKPQLAQVLTPSEYIKFEDEYRKGQETKARVDEAVAKKAKADREAQDADRAHKYEVVQALDKGLADVNDQPSLEATRWGLRAAGFSDQDLADLPTDYGDGSQVGRLKQLITHTKGLFPTAAGPQKLQHITVTLPGVGKVPASFNPDTGRIMRGTQDITEQAVEEPGGEKVTGPEMDQRFQVLEAKRLKGIPLTPDEKADWQAYKNRKEDVTRTTFNLNAPFKEDVRGDRSYTYNSGLIQKARTPLQAQADRLERLETSINMRTPTADALIAPELLTVMAGGQGSGLRLNEAEISRVVGGRSNWESLKAKLNQWSLDPSKALSVTDEQRTEMRTLLREVQQRSRQKLTALDNAMGQLVETNDPTQHRRIVSTALKALEPAAAPAEAPPTTSPTAGGKVRMTGPDGKAYMIPADKVAEAKARGFK